MWQFVSCFGNLNTASATVYVLITTLPYVICGERTFGCTAPRIFDCRVDTVHSPLVLFHLLLAAVETRQAPVNNQTSMPSGTQRGVTDDSLHRTNRCVRK